MTRNGWRWGWTQLLVLTFAIILAACQNPTGSQAGGDGVGDGADDPGSGGASQAAVVPRFTPGSQWLIE